MKARLLFVLFFPLALQAASPDFNRDIRPLLSDRCYKCHGPGEQKGRLRLDRRDEALSVLSPEDPAKSEFLHRIFIEDMDEVMPPSGKARALSSKEKETLRAWIEAGAEYDQHWAYKKPEKATVPAATHPVDHFVRLRLKEEKLELSSPAALETLCRRLHLDLIGLPPSPEDVEAFVSSALHSRSEAVESLVNSLLASPRFGEKWARHWLDLARYGDSAGYQHDDDMPLWLYRDWVIEALNADMPFDQFTIQQIAGDLLPNATSSQRIATGFHRSSTVTLGADQNAEELHAQLVWDRVNTVGTTWLATSLECAQCHTHKFDPITIEDYYQLYAYFNRTSPELTKQPGSHYFITGGVLELPDDETRTARAASLRRQMENEIASLLKGKPKLAEASLRRIYTGPPSFRTPERVYYYLTEELRTAGPPEIRSQIATLRELGRELMENLPPRSLVLEENPNPPVSHVLLRGNIRTPGPEVSPGVPAALHPLPPGAPANRLGLAQWLVSRENPLTARVTVNRWWAELFGAGLVSTLDDFGLQGDAPSHPELLDWLAVELMDNGWSMKRLLKLIVMSETYSQSSALTPTLLARDPENRLLARGPRYRLDAELLRDNALTIGGLLNHAIGGAPAYAIPQDGSKERAAFNWRRGIYIRQQRGEPYTTFISLDAPDRFACVAKRSRTNTPLQALALLNEPAFIGAAKGLVARLDQELPQGDFEARLTRMFRICIARTATRYEQEALRVFFDKTMRDGADASTAWLLIANVLLNLDETLTKE